MPPTVSILTPSYNKHEFVVEGIQSVLSQTFSDFEYWIVDNSTDGLTRKVLRPLAKKDPRIKYLEFDFTPKQRLSFYVPAYIINQVYPEMAGKYIFYMSDDDLLKPNCLKYMVNFLESNPKARVCYHTMEYIAKEQDKWVQTSVTTADKNLGRSTNHSVVDCYLDGGAIMHRKNCLDKLSYPYMPEDLEGARHCDGAFMQRLAKLWTFFAIPQQEVLSVHRSTPQSTWIKPPSLRR